MQFTFNCNLNLNARIIGIIDWKRTRQKSQLAWINEVLITNFWFNQSNLTYTIGPLNDNLISSLEFVIFLKIFFFFFMIFQCLTRVDVTRRNFTLGMASGSDLMSFAWNSILPITIYPLSTTGHLSQWNFTWQECTSICHPTSNHRQVYIMQHTI